ncbi:uncharacterized protein LOC130676363 [Microplitis mediator]|uniref:uncharacterized protein LOC130676363 n=1 Tax=Microplitis mediator TaxID=375433 RepID=UPI0025576602|nr:uncharacterized protein LOC130676363 [Microplitis mediator]
MVDFEKAFIESFKEIYSGVKVSGCNFHFNQCIWRRLQSCGLQKMYNTDVIFAHNIRFIAALAFNLPEHVISGNELIVSSDYYERNIDILDDFIGYIETTWIGGLSRSKKKRGNPRFNIKMWNCYKAVVDDLIRSNNPMEEWHSGFNRRVGVCQPFIGMFLNSIKDEQSKTETSIAQIDSGLDVSTSRCQTYRDYDTRLKKILMNYDSNDKFRYLKNVAKIISIQ